MVCPHSTVSQSVNTTGSTAVLEDIAAQKHRSNGMFSTIVPVPYLTDKGRSKEHSISQTGTFYADGETMHNMNY